jgi:hypothetical protein
MMRLGLLAATVSFLALSLFAPGTLAATQANMSAPGGTMICDGLTGCYIIPTVGPAAGAWLADCSGDFFNGPISCERTLDIPLPSTGTQTWVNTGVLCQVYVPTGDFTTVLVYESTHGTIIVHQSGTTLTMTAICPASPGA